MERQAVDALENVIDLVRKGGQLRGRRRITHYGARLPPRSIRRVDDSSIRRQSNVSGHNLRDLPGQGTRVDRLVALKENH